MTNKAVALTRIFRSKATTIPLLLYQALLEVFSQVRAGHACNVVGGNFLHIVVDHDLHELFERRLLRVPAEFGPRLGRVAPEVHHVGRAVEIFRDGDDGLAGGNVDALFMDAFAFPAEFYACMVESEGCKFTDGVLYAGCNHEVFGLVVLQNEPHAFHVVLGVAPVAKAVEVAEVQAILLALGNAGCGERDLAGHEGFATAFGFMVEEDAGAAEHVVSFAVFLDDPEAVKLGDCVRAVRVERSVLVLRDLFYLAVEFAGRGLVNAAGLFEVVGAHGLKHAENASSINVGGEFRGVKRNLHMALGREVIDFGRLDLAHDLHEAHGVAHVGVVQVEIRLAFKVCNAFAVVHRRAADDTVNFIALGEEEFRKIGAVLTGDACDECYVTLIH